MRKEVAQCSIRTFCEAVNCVPKDYQLNSMLLIEGGKMTTGKIRCGDFTWMMRIALTAIIVVVVTLSGNPVYSACESADNIPTILLCII